ncbi:MAG: imidazoleglycerol-phosphate dehydratase HisB [Chloroflexi bacterium]|nr:imidazoleglycerol-phosphate dehydratase HisB [Chloroflexota bacterium]
MNAPRIGTVDRKTRETQIHLELDLDGRGVWQGSSSVPFMDHMLQHLAVHSHIDLSVDCQGDTEIDDHHTIEDLGISLGLALKEAVGDKAGMTRYGSQFIPMDEALVLVALDFSGRGMLVYDVELLSERVSDFETCLVREFMQALAANAGLTLHIKLMHGRNSHHVIEAAFKALGRALEAAVELDPRQAGVPSTKGMLA